MNRKLSTVFTLPALLALSGCAGYRLTPLSPDQATAAHDGSQTEGYIFYEPEPYLLGTLKATQPGAATSTQGVAAYEFKIVYLPNKERPYRFTRYEFFAKSDIKLTFEDGWKLTNANSATDSTAALTALVELAKAVSPFGVKANLTPDAMPSILLYRIDLRGNQPKLIQATFEAN